MRSTRSRLRVSVALAAVFVAGCGGDNLIAPAPEDIRDYIAALATSGGVDAVFHTGIPVAGSGPTLVLNGTSAMITGGSAIRGLSSGQAFTRLIVAVTGVDGYWEITLPLAVTVEELVITLGQNVPASAFTMNFAAGSAGGLGTFESEAVAVIVVGTGAIQVSVTWNSNADVDLHVVDPASTEIYWFNSSSPSGGVLDLDSNAACAGDNIRNENITWPSATPPSGTYTVRVDLWDACGATSTDYVVTVRRRNQAPLTFSGTLTGLGDEGGAGSGVTVTTFTY